MPCPRCSRLYRLAALATAGLIAGQAVLTVFYAVLTLAVATPIGWMQVVWALWQLAFASVIAQMQFGCGRGCLSKYAGFLDRRLGRGMFFLYLGVSGGNSASSAPFHMVVLAYAVLAMCWFVGLYEMFGGGGADDEEPLTAPAGLAPLGAALCADSGGGGSNPISINVTPDQAIGAATFVANNSCLVASAAAARSNAAGGAWAGGGGSSTC